MFNFLGPVVNPVIRNIQNNIMANQNGGKRKKRQTPEQRQNRIWSFIKNFRLKMFVVTLVMHCSNVLFLNFVPSLFHNYPEPLLRFDIKTVCEIKMIKCFLLVIDQNEPKTKIL